MALLFVYRLRASNVEPFAHSFQNFIDNIYIDRIRLPSDETVAQKQRKRPYLFLTGSPYTILLKCCSNPNISQ